MVRCPAFVQLQVKKGVNKIAAALFAWSIQICMDGVWPEVGFCGEELKGYRASVKGKPLASGWKRLASLHRVMLEVACFDAVAVFDSGQLSSR